MENNEGKTLKLVVAYDGTRFKSWQKGNGRTVQGVLEEAIAGCLGSASRGAVRDPVDIALVGAGRTDAGVHAAGQVASLRVPASVDPALLLSALGGALDDDLSVLSVQAADDRFHARYRATAKTYRYRIVDGPCGNPFLHRYSWRVADTLDLKAMEAASRALIGELDFSSCTADKGKKDKTRNVYSIDFERPRTDGRPPLDMLFRGDGFLWNQVRIMAALLVAAGKKKTDAAAIEKLLAARDRSLAPAPAPACGLTLVSVEYDNG